MALKAKYQYKHEAILRDARPLSVRVLDSARTASTGTMVMGAAVILIWREEVLARYFADFIFLLCAVYTWWLLRQPVNLPFKLPKSANRRDPNFKRPDGSTGMADGILYLGNDKDTGEEIWFTNSDARTHCLYLGTTGSGKTFGLKSYVCNALCWASGFIYIDGKADTDLWSTISAMARRFGRDDDLLIMNYMTGNTTARIASNTMNPFSSGSASYLTNMLVSLMPDSEGDNAMWKERAVALVSALMPCLVWKRENQNIPLSIGVIRRYLTFPAVIKLSRDTAVPDHLRAAVRAYLEELPGYVDNVFDDNGEEKPGPDGSMPDTQTPRSQHGYLSMQFTRSMQSLGDDYGFIFDTQAADIDMMDVVLNRRILIVLIPALEKSGDETANLGKIIASTLKGMMGATLGSTVEGDTETAIENKPTNSATPFIAVFDEVGYYTSQGMAVMAAQARSLGFSLVFAGQDLPALEKRVKEEARSITANCNIKLFGKLEDPTQTKEFFEKTVGQAIVTEVSGFARAQGGGSGSGYMDSQNASVQVRARASYDGLKGFTEGRAICAFGSNVAEMQVYNSDIGHAKAMRVHRFLPIPPPSEDALESLRLVESVLRRMRNPKWNAAAMDTPPARDITALAEGFALGRAGKTSLVESAALAVAQIAVSRGTVTAESAMADTGAVAPLTPMEVDESAERAAGTVIERETAGAGPLSWMQVIGASDLPGQEAVPQQDDPDTWSGAVERVGGAGAAAAAGAALDAPLSWMDVIGGGDAPLEPAVTTPAVTQPSTSTDDLFADMAGLSPAQDVPMDDDMPFGHEDDVPPATEDTGAADPVNNPLSWADVLGTTDGTGEE